MPTATTLPLTILILFLWRQMHGQILPIILFTSVFEAASAFNLGGLGVPPWLFALLICFVLRLVEGHRKLRFAKGINSVAVRILTIFFCYAALSGLIYPFIFAGTPVVNMSGPVAQPLSWSRNNLAQLCYLLAAMIVYFFTVTRTREEQQNALRWYVRACYVVALFALYQLANAIVHVPYPDLILYSNPSHVIYHAYRINGMWRLNSTFSEASAMASCLTVGIALHAWTVATTPLSIKRISGLLLMLIALFLTVSSLAYASLIFTVLIGGTIHLIGVGRSGAISPRKLIIALLLLTALTTLFTVSKSAVESVTRAASVTLLDKKDSQSFRERSLTSAASLETFSQTWYLGAGWGSVRASGLFYILLGNIGVPGVALFVCAYISLFFPLLHRRDRGAAMQTDDSCERSLFALTVLGFGLILAGAEPVEPILWALFGIATAARIAPVAHSASGLGARRLSREAYVAGRGLAFFRVAAK